MRKKSATCCGKIKNSNKLKNIIRALPRKMCSENDRFSGFDIMIGTDCKNEDFGKCALMLTLNNIRVHMGIKILEICVQLKIKIQIKKNTF